MLRVIFSLIFLISPYIAWSAEFDSFQTLLNKHLKVTTLPGGGLQTAFDYDGLFSDKDSMKLIDQQKKALESFDLKQLSTKNLATAFWINAYNFHMVRIIVEMGFKKGKRDIDSVKDFGSFFNPYAIFKKDIINIGGKTLSLDGIEKGTLLSEEYKKKSWKDARIHFAVNCASVGCPPLIKEIYKADTLDKTLDDNIKAAFKTPRHLAIKGNELHLTHLFKWYKKDFEEHSGNIRAFIKKYVTDPTKIDATGDIEYIDYDWKLNIPQHF